MSEHDGPRPTRSFVVGSHTPVTIGLLALVVGLAYWTGRQSDRIDHVEERVPAAADAAKAYTDLQVSPLKERLDDIVRRLDRIEQAVNTRRGGN